MKRNRREYDRPHLSPEMKMADLINLNYRLLEVLSRLEISLGFGDITVGQACKRHKVDVDAFLLICNVYTYEGYLPSASCLSSADPLSVVKYLHGSHIFYMSEELPELEAAILRMVEPFEKKLKDIILGFFSGYRNEVGNHFAYEEETVFPYVRNFASGKRGGAYSIEQFEENHSNIEEKLADLKNIVMKYLPENCDTVLRNKVLYHICFLQEDMDRHTSIENNVLIPMMSILEGNEKQC